MATATVFRDGRELEADSTAWPPAEEARFWADSARGFRDDFLFESFKIQK